LCPHAAKALTKKLWYLRDQGTVVTTNPADRQTGLQKQVTGRKDHLHQGENPRPVLIKPKTANHSRNTAPNAPAKKDHFHHRRASPIKAGKAVMTNRQAASTAAKSGPIRRETNRIPAGRLITTTSRKGALAVIQQLKGNHLRQRAGHTPAG